ncbi:MAG: mechanosensitive ion channel family protein [Calditrichales bacterium]|nr:MAG: mechanosensitive ion channel family protein [Calditrichales bacterium]
MNFEFYHRWLALYPLITQLIAAVAILLIAYLAYFITRRYILHLLQTLVLKSRFTWDDLLLDPVIMRRLAYALPVIIFYNSAVLFPGIESIIKQTAYLGLLILALILAGSFLTALNNLYESSQLSKGRPIKGVIQITKLFLYIVGAVIIISILLGKSPWYFVSGIGAMTAVILLIFRDTILSFVASLQISSNDLVRVNDWIEVPAFGADGDVTDIALHTIKVQNWDKTITIIPTHKLIDVSFKNWRGMQMTGGRRIKRSIYIDQTSIKFCTDDMLSTFSNFKLIRQYIADKKTEIDAYNAQRGFDGKDKINARRMTNVGTFRIYVESYLKQNDKIHQGLTAMVRQLPPGPEGLPLEVYVFTNTTDWIAYERIQADIFDHLLSVIPHFELQIVQNPSGSDFRALLGNIEVNV